MKTILNFLCLLIATLVACGSAQAEVIVLQGSVVEFNAFVGTLPVMDFDDFAPGTDLAGITIRGVTFISPPGNTLSVVDASSTFITEGLSPAGDSDNTLVATTGGRVLSPGVTWRKRIACAWSSIPRCVPLASICSFNRWMAIP